MLTNEARKDLERQQYRIVGSHSAVKTCGWTKKMIRGEGGCYKLTFYGINSSQCMQMTTAMSCANRCVFCWRGYKAPVSKEWEGVVDDPQLILENSVKAHKQLLIGFKNHDHVIKKVYEDSNTVKHVALSLTGEPIIYPKINEFLKLCNEKGISTFMVTNAQYPEQIKDLEPVTQLYLSLDAPNKKLLKEIDKPLFNDYWERLEKSLEYLSEKKGRTCIRLTIIKSMNAIEPENYAKLIIKGDPDFIEVKGYVFVGASRQVLTKTDMPFHENVVEFSEQVLKHLPEYEIVTEHVPSRVVLLAKKKFKIEGKWMTWIDYPKWHKLVNNEEKSDINKNNDPAPEKFLKTTPTTGLSGIKTKELFKKKGIKFED